MKTIKKFIYEMLSKDGSISSMRVGLISLVWMASILVACMGVYIIKRTFDVNGTIDWQGLSILLCAIGAFLTPIVAGKVTQKKHE